jgi:hypothetical protein
MSQWPAMLLPLLTVFACGSYGDPEALPPTDAADASPAPDARDQGDASSQTACDYKTPPRCSPRSCIARCVTCFYDECRAAGGSCSECKWEMELCKNWCARPPY